MGKESVLKAVVNIKRIKAVVKTGIKARIKAVCVVLSGLAMAVNQRLVKHECVCFVSLVLEGI